MMIRLGKRPWLALLPVLLIILVSCSPSRETFTPYAPVDWVIEVGGVVSRSLPIHLHHSHFQLFSFGADGSMQTTTFDEELFPVEVYVVYNPALQTAQAFLARSPHGGCLLIYNSDERTFEDPCYGSRFDMEGRYEMGPSPRDLDQLPAEVRGQMIWVKNELVYGKEHP